MTAAPVAGRAPKSRVLNLSPEVWAVLEGKFSDLGRDGRDSHRPGHADGRRAHRAARVAGKLAAGPLLRRHRSGRNAHPDAQPGRGLQRAARVGEIVGALGQTNDLTPEIVARMLELAPSMIDHFEADQLVALPDDVFAVLPEDCIAGLDGFTGTRWRPLHWRPASAARMCRQSCPAAFRLAYPAAAAHQLQLRRSAPGDLQHLWPGHRQGYVAAHCLERACPAGHACPRHIGSARREQDINPPAAGEFWLGRRCRPFLPCLGFSSARRWIPPTT